ncbi:MAG TPA: hypothetical protein V6D17_25030 [Candidatus Obscuribacterales bacterium]
MSYPKWLVFYYHALEAERRGDEDMAEDLMRKALILAYETGWLNHLLPDSLHEYPSLMASQAGKLLRCGLGAKFK